jgi:hypothetical protein
MLYFCVKMLAISEFYTLFSNTLPDGVQVYEMRSVSHSAPKWRESDGVLESVCSGTCVSGQCHLSRPSCLSHQSLMANTHWWSLFSHCSQSGVQSHLSSWLWCKSCWLMQCSSFIPQYSSPSADLGLHPHQRRMLQRIRVLYSAAIFWGRTTRSFWITLDLLSLGCPSPATIRELSPWHFQGYKVFLSSKYSMN